MANRKIIFPQSPMVDLQTGYLALEWFMWFQNPQFLSIVLGTPIDVVNGGTGLTSGTSGGILGFTGSTTLASSVALTQHAIVIGGGAGATPTPLGSLGTTTTVLHGNASGDPTFGAVSLTADITGTLGATHGGTGFASYAVGDILYADTTTTLAKLADVATKQVLVSGGINTAPAWSPNLTLSGDLSIEGNTTLGDASGDSLTINAGTWTYGNNFTATRSAGTLATGTTNILSTNVTFTGDAGGASNGIATQTLVQVLGGNAVATCRAFGQVTEHSGSATITTAQALRGAILLDSTGNITNATVLSGIIQLTNSGSVTNGIQFQAGPPVLTGTGTISTHIGFQSGNLGNATLVTNAIGFDATNMTAAATLTASYRSQQNSGTGVWGYLHTGTANNGFNGNVRIGSNVAPTVALDVTGAALISSTLGVTGALSANTIQVLTGTTATVYNSAATTVNAFGGATTLTMGAATGTSTIGNTLVTAASTTGRPGLRMPSGTAPTSPTSGDFWYDGSALKFQDGGTTRTITWV